MNNTNHGRWGRYKIIKGVKHKICNGPLHQEEGEWLTLDKFFIMKNGARKGKPESRCKACRRFQKDRLSESGYIEIDKVKWIFLELQNRLGKTEVVRRLNLGTNFWVRLENKTQKYMQRRNAIKAFHLLQEVRAKNEVRHRTSIKRGAALRGEKEKVPSDPRDFYQRDWNS